MKLRFLAMAAVATLMVPAAGFGSSIGGGPELNLDFFGNTQLQWSVITSSDKATYALYGKESFIAAPGLTFFYIHDRNVYLGATALYRNFPGEFQVPGDYPNRAVNFEEEVLILRLGYIDYFRGNSFMINDLEPPILKACPFGHFRIGIFRTDISGSGDFRKYQPAYAGSLGLEMGAVFLPAGNFFFTLSGLVDYSFTVTPYRAKYPGETDEILSNVLMFGLSLQFGFLSETP